MKFIFVFALLLSTGIAMAESTLSQSDTRILKPLDTSSIRILSDMWK